MDSYHRNSHEPAVVILIRNYTSSTVSFNQLHSGLDQASEHGRYGGIFVLPVFGS